MCVSFDFWHSEVYYARRQKMKRLVKYRNTELYVGYLQRPSSPDRCHLAMPSFAQEAMIGKVQNVVHHRSLLDGKKLIRWIIINYYHYHYYHYHLHLHRHFHLHLHFHLTTSVLDPPREINDWSAAKNRSRIDMWNWDTWGNSSAALAPLPEARVLWGWTEETWFEDVERNWLYIKCISYAWNISILLMDSFLLHDYLIIQYCWIRNQYFCIIILPE